MKPEPNKCFVWDNDGRLQVGGWLGTTITDIVNVSRFSHFETDKGEKIYLEDIATYIHNGGKVWVVMRKGE